MWRKSELFLLSFQHQVILLSISQLFLSIREMFAMSDPCLFFMQHPKKLVAVVLISRNKYTKQNWRTRTLELNESCIIDLFSVEATSTKKKRKVTTAATLVLMCPVCNDGPFTDDEVGHSSGPRQLTAHMLRDHFPDLGGSSEPKCPHCCGSCTGEALMLCGVKTHCASGGQATRREIVRTVIKSTPSQKERGMVSVFALESMDLGPATDAKKVFFHPFLKCNKLF